MTDTSLFVAKITSVMAGTTCRVAVITSSLANITFVVAEITFKIAVITSSVAKITFVVAEITFKVAVITSSVAKITFVVTDITFIVAVQWSLSLLKNGFRECCVVHFVVFTRNKILYIHVKALDSDLKDFDTFLNLGTHWAKM